MLNNLRLRLSLLYLLVAILLVALLSGSTYSVLYYYFQNANDSALKTKLVNVLDAIGAPVPEELETGESRESITKDADDFGEREDDERFPHTEEIYEGDLSSIFVLPLDASGQLLFNPNPYEPPMQPNSDAVNAALVNGIDYRNASLDDGTPARLLTYALSEQAGIEIIQTGKSIGDQIHILNQFLTSLLLIGAVVIVGLGAGSWWMAGRTLASHQKAWDNQQTFIANASHELRTPLTLIRASAEAAQRIQRNKTKIHGLLEDIISETDHMCNLVEELLLLTRLDAGQLKLSFSLIDVQELFHNIEREFSRVANELSVSFHVKGQPLEIKSDYTRLRQVLLIMLDNAFQHTSSGGLISLQAIAEGSHVRFSVTDSGEGIPKESLPFVFDRFYQVKAERGGENHGSGLGLSIAKSLVDALGGTIEIESEVGKGTSLFIFLPLSK